MYCLSFIGIKGFTLINISVVALTHCRYRRKDAHFTWRTVWKAHLYKTRFKVHMAPLYTLIPAVTPVVCTHNSHSRLTQTSFSCVEFQKRVKCMWYYGDEVCYRSMLDAEVETLDAEWMCRITKSTHTRLY